MLKTSGSLPGASPGFGRGSPSARCPSSVLDSSGCGQADAGRGVGPATRIAFDGSADRLQVSGRKRFLVQQALRRTDKQVAVRRKYRHRALERRVDQLAPPDPPRKGAESVS